MDEMTIDEMSGKPIRLTDNGPKNGDLAASQEPRPLELGDDCLPVGWEAPDGDA